jgi:hypothetical protein
MYVASLVAQLLDAASGELLYLLISLRGLANDQYASLLV